MLFLKLFKRNMILFISYTKFRITFFTLFSGIFIFLTGILKKQNGLISVFFGTEAGADIKLVPTSWLFMLIVPMLIIGNAQNVLQKRDYLVVNNVSLFLYYISNLLVSIILVFFMSLVWLLSCLVENSISVSFIIYIFCYLLITTTIFHVLSLFINSLYILLIYVSLLIFSVYFDFFKVINETMFLRHSLNFPIKELFVLSILMIIVVYFGYKNLKKIDYV